ncbi:hypothetical protein O0L34_g11431 [Tuta absoluta]|nr:hypothetical protein O0L34_g11431 [Tuta absoluta]
MAALQQQCSGVAQHKRILLFLYEFYHTTTAQQLLCSGAAAGPEYFAAPLQFCCSCAVALQLKCRAAPAQCSFSFIKLCYGFTTGSHVTTFASAHVCAGECIEACYATNVKNTCHSTDFPFALVLSGWAHTAH